jgi:hypothetical protein
MCLWHTSNTTTAFNIYESNNALNNDFTLVCHNVSIMYSYILRQDQYKYILTDLTVVETMYDLNAIVGVCGSSFGYDKLLILTPHSLFDHQIPPLLFAVSTGNERLVKLLLDAGANVNGCDSRQYTALHYATASGYR